MKYVPEFRKVETAHNVARYPKFENESKLIPTVAGMLVPVDNGLTSSEHGYSLPYPELPSGAPVIRQAPSRSGAEECRRGGGACDAV